MTRPLTGPLTGPGTLDLRGDPVALTAALTNVPSVSGAEGPLADLVEAALRAQAPHLRLDRDGDALVARTSLGRPQRVVVAGHLDTVPAAGNLPSRRDGGRLYGCGTSDMKAGVAVALHLAATVADPAYDVTWLFYDHEEVEAARNGLGRLERGHPDWLAGDLAVLMEPTDGAVEAGCQGTLRVAATLRGRRAHTARAWLGDNAVHAAGPLLERLRTHRAREVEIDGCRFREGLQAVDVRGGVAGNVVPDVCTVTVNHRFAPDRSPAQALAHVREVLSGYDVELLDVAAGALPGLAAPAAARFVAATGRTPVAKLGWTDVSRFSARGMAALNYGPGDPNVAHTSEESVDVARITEAVAVLGAYLRG